MNGVSSPVGTPIAIGFVLKVPCEPPYGTVGPAPLPPFPTVMIPIQPAAAASSAYSPKRPICPVLKMLTQQVADVFAFAIAFRIDQSET